MLRRPSQFSFLWGLISALVILFLGSGCGGGTSGTGDPGIISVKSVSGIVRSPVGLPLAGIKVESSNYNDQVVTGVDGSFTFATAAENGTIELLLSDSSGEASLRIDNLTEDHSDLYLVLQLDQTNYEASILSISFEPITLPSEGEGGGDAVAPGEEQVSSDEVERVVWEGTVISDTGDLISGVRITLSPSRRSDTTDSIGRFNFTSDLKDENYSLKVSYNGLEDTVTVGKLPQGSDLHVSLQLLLRFTVVSSENGSSEQLEAEVASLSVS